MQTLPWQKKLTRFVLEFGFFNFVHCFVDRSWSFCGFSFFFIRIMSVSLRTFISFLYLPLSCRVNLTCIHYLCTKHVEWRGMSYLYNAARVTYRWFISVSPSGFQMHIAFSKKEKSPFQWNMTNMITFLKLCCIHV